MSYIYNNITIPVKHEIEKYYALWQKYIFITESSDRTCYFPISGITYYYPMIQLKLITKNPFSLWALHLHSLQPFRRARLLSVAPPAGTWQNELFLSPHTPSRDNGSPSRGTWVSNSSPPPPQETLFLREDDLRAFSLSARGRAGRANFRETTRERTREWSFLRAGCWVSNFLIGRRARHFRSFISWLVGQPGVEGGHWLRAVVPTREIAPRLFRREKSPPPPPPLFIQFTDDDGARDKRVERRLFCRIRARARVRFFFRKGRALELSRPFVFVSARSVSYSSSCFFFLPCEWFSSLRCERFDFRRSIIAGHCIYIPAGTGSCIITLGRTWVAPELRLVEFYNARFCIYKWIVYLYFYCNVGCLWI